FLRDLSARPGRSLRLAPEVESSLAGIIDFYRGQEAQRVRGVWVDSFGAPRAAKVGARARWALEGGEESPLAHMVRDLSPAVAVVLYGGNDAAYRVAPPDSVAADFTRDLERIVDALEKEGIIPILDTVARHGSAPGIGDC